MAKFTKELIRERIEGNEVDLSLSQLTTIPVKELLLFPRATFLDLSCNLLSELPENFCLLRHLIKLDLSKNRLTFLPEAFGELNQLQKLDLYSNRLTTLPLSVAFLTDLKWLDLKGNSLETELATAAGPCTDDKECRQCAKQVVALVKRRGADHERAKQELLKVQRAKAAELEEEERRRREDLKRQRAAEKQRRKEKFLAEQKAKESRGNDDESQDGEEPIDDDNVEDASGTRKQISETGGSNSSHLLLIGILVALVAIVAGAWLYCTNDPSRCSALKSRLGI